MKTKLTASNMKINGEWAKHVRKMKKSTSKIRRVLGKKIIRQYTMD